MKISKSKRIRAKMMKQQLTERIRPRMRQMKELIMKKSMN